VDDFVYDFVDDFVYLDDFVPQQSTWYSPFNILNISFFHKLTFPVYYPGDMRKREERRLREKIEFIERRLRRLSLLREREKIEFIEREKIEKIEFIEKECDYFSRN